MWALKINWFFKEFFYNCFTILGNFRFNYLRKLFPLGIFNFPFQTISNLIQFIQYKQKRVRIFDPILSLSFNSKCYYKMVFNFPPRILIFPKKYGKQSFIILPEKKPGSKCRHQNRLLISPNWLHVTVICNNLSQRHKKWQISFLNQSSTQPKITMKKTEKKKISETNNKTLLPIYNNKKKVTHI